MTVATETDKTGPLPCNGATTVFNYLFRILDEDDLEVILTDSAGAETVLTKTTHYTVTGVGDAAGGSITTVSTYASGNTITLVRNPDLVQEVDLQNQGAFLAESIERALDRATMQVQKAYGAAARGLQVPKSDASASLEIPTAATRAGKALIFDDDGNATAGGVPDVAVSAPMYPVVQAVDLAAARTALGLGGLAEKSDSDSITWTGTQTMSGAAINEAEGTAIASATTIDLDATTGNFVHVTGTTTITGITLSQGRSRTVVFDDALTLTNGAGLLLGGANIVTVAGDTAIFRGEGSSVTRLVSYMRADQRSIQDASTTQKGAVELATVAETQTGTDATRAVTPDGFSGASLGYEQTWQDVSGSRVVGTTYTNTTGKPIVVAIRTSPAVDSVLQVNGPTWLSVQSTSVGAGNTQSMSAIIPSGVQYRLASGSAFTTWAELRS